MASVCLSRSDWRFTLTPHSSRDGIHTTEIELATKILDSDGKYRTLIALLLTDAALWFLKNEYEIHFLMKCVTSHAGSSTGIQRKDTEKSGKDGEPVCRSICVASYTVINRAAKVESKRADIEVTVGFSPPSDE